MAIVESIGCVKAYDENVKVEEDDLEDYEQLMMSESCTYHKLDTEQRSIPQVYNTILVQNEDKNV